MNLTPRAENVILEPFRDDARGARLFQRERSVVLTDEYQDEPSRLARVVAVGLRVIEPKVGWTVLCNRYPASAQSFKFEGQEFVSVKEDEILARIEVV